MQVVLSARARADLREIAGFIAQDNPHRAVSFVRKLQASALAIGTQPFAFPLVDRFQRSGIRRKSYRDYLILYVPTDISMNIVRILHGARDYSALLDPEFQLDD